MNVLLNERSGRGGPWLTGAIGINALVCKLLSFRYTLLTRNGAGFDLDILAEESGLMEQCRVLALGT
jgi:hypothetical protein